MVYGQSCDFALKHLNGSQFCPSHCRIIAVVTAYSGYTYIYPPPPPPPPTTTFSQLGPHQCLFGDDSDLNKSNTKVLQWSIHYVTFTTLTHQSGAHNLVEDKGVRGQPTPHWLTRVKVEDDQVEDDSTLHWLISVTHDLVEDNGVRGQPTPHWLTSVVYDQIEDESTLCTLTHQTVVHGQVEDEGVRGQPTPHWLTRV